MITTTGTKTGLGLIGTDLAGTLADRITRDHPGIQRAEAERIIDQTVAFLAACATNTGSPLSPSSTVDIGWHTFILHTEEYAAFCEAVAGHFLHHTPDDPAEADEFGAAADNRSRTLAAIAAAGYRVDTELWPTTADCRQSHGECRNSPEKNEK